MHCSQAGTAICHKYMQPIVCEKHIGSTLLPLSLPLCCHYITNSLAITSAAMERSKVAAAIASVFVTISKLILAVHSSASSMLHTVLHGTAVPCVRAC